MNRRETRGWSAALVAAVAIGAPSLVAAAPETDSGLVRQASSQFDAVYRLPGARWDGYRKVLIDGVAVTFNRNWLRDMNAYRNTARPLTQDEVRVLSDDLGASLSSALADAFAARGYTVVAAPGPDVLRLSPRLEELYVNAPDTRTPGRKAYVTEVGEATLSLEARDAQSGKLLGRAVDRERARTAVDFKLADSVSNRFEFDAMFRRWAQAYVQGLEAAKSQP